MTEKQFLYLMGQVDEGLIESAEAVDEKKKPPHWLKWGSIAAAVTLAVLVSLPLLGGANNIELGDRSIGVTVKHTNIDPNKRQAENMLIYLTEEELFTHWETAIFEGTVKKVDNIVLDFNGAKEYRALAEVSVERVYRGELTAGETAVILLPCSVVNGVWVEDTDTVIATQEGKRGIFMPIVYDDDSYFEYNGATLYLNELAPYGFADGLRYIFWDTASGAVYAKNAYPSLEGVRSFDEIREYVVEMIAKTSGK